MKKRMKRLMFLGLAALFVFAGCSKEPEAPVVEETQEITIEEVKTSEEIVEEENAETVPLTINIDTNNKTYYFEGGEDAYLYLRYCDVSVEGDGYEKLKRNLENWSMDRSEGLRSLYASFEESASTEAEEGESFYGYSLYQSVEIARADGAIVSLLDDTYQYTGGAHGMLYRDGINFDAQTGKRLELSDFFYDYEFFVEEAKERIIYELEAEYGEDLFDNYATVVEELWMDDGEPQWYVDASSIVIVFQEYAVGPYAMGTPEVHLPYTEFAPYIKEEYFPGVLEGVASFEKNQEIFLTLPGFEEEVPMMLVSEMKDEEMVNALWLGQNKLALDSFLVLEDTYIIRNGEEVYCLLETDMASDDYVTYIYRLTKGKIEKIDEMNASIDAGNINPHKIQMESYVYLLGTYGGVKTYHFDENGKFVTENTEYALWRNEFVLTSTVELPIVLDEVESTLPAGSHIILHATDGETYVKFTIQETGQKGVLNIERGAEDYYDISINGMNENDCFELLPYAG